MIQRWYLFYFIFNTATKIFISLFNVMMWSFLYKIKINYHLWSNERIEDKTIYILGTGQSVNYYSDSDWERIKTGYSIGLNMWVLHDFVPTILQLELYSENDDYLNYLIKIFELRQNDFLKTKIIFKGNYLYPWKYKNINKFFSKIPKSLKNNIYFTVDFRVSGSNIIDFTKSIRWLNKIKFFDARQKYNLFTAQPRASLGLAVVLSIQSGFKHISLCGVDLNNDDHFYDNTNYYLKKYGIDFIRNEINKTIHLTNDISYSELTISRALSIIEEEICKSRNIKISVGSINSILYPRFSYTFSGNFLSI